jgi:RNase H-fold protein (predicted Holliday junction resolvase)
MLKLKLALDTSNRHHMTALSNFAAELAVVQIKQEREAEGAVVVAPKPEPVAEEKPKKSRIEKHVEEIAQTFEKPEPVAEEKPKKAPAAEKQVAEKAPAEKIEDSKPAASKITLDDVRRAVAEKKDAHFEIMKFKLKEDFGVTKTPDLKPEDYERFYNFVNSL